MKLLSQIKKILFSRISVCAAGIAVQLAYLVMLFWTLGTMFSYSYIVFLVLGFAAALYIMNKDLNPSYKLIWVFLVLSFPIFGCMFYWFYGHRRTKSSPLLAERHLKLMPDDGETADRLLNTDETAAKQARYIRRYGRFPLYDNTETEYFPNGESLFPALLAELERAERFIFAEYFIIEAGVMWNSVLEILERKAQSGVDVRVIYDDVGCLLTLPRDYFKTLEKKGIQCRAFGRLKPFWSPKMNNRDHRKILVIDGKCALTGGINLADEYINGYEKHGYWKDSAVMLRGGGVYSFTLMFLALWDHINGSETSPDGFMAEHEVRAEGFVLPYMDSPNDDEPVGENVYINMISGARRYVYITTPYLITDNEMLSELVLAAKNGTDVRIITPHIADKKFVHAVTRANYLRLVRHGVRIYEFTPGFIHAKNFVSDDLIAAVGTINLDFRSLYLHYECGVWMYGTPAVEQVKRDFLSTLEQCAEITEADCQERNIFKRIGRAVLRLFSPMM